MILRTHVPLQTEHLVYQIADREQAMQLLIRKTIT